MKNSCKIFNSAFQETKRCSYHFLKKFWKSCKNKSNNNEYWDIKIEFTFFFFDNE